MDVPSVVGDEDDDRTIRDAEIVHAGEEAPDRIVEGWAAAGFAGLDQAEMRRLVELAPELVLLGTGARQRFPAAALLGPLLDARIGFEIMDLQAACRTYNILMAEGRRVAAALLFG